MPYPPEFDSSRNITYGNRQDLDKLPVFLEGDSSNPMFFKVEGIPQYLSLGKHYFYISKQEDHPQLTNLPYRLQNNTQILFEAKSPNDVVIVSGVKNINQHNGVATCFLDLLDDPRRTYKEIWDGLGTLTLVGTLTSAGQIIPDEWKDRVNYRCTFPIDIRKNLLNADSPKITSPTHKLNTAQGQFSFATAHFTPQHSAPVGMNFNDNGDPDLQNPVPSGTTT
tara:strand:- start:2361 stop:3029 length:669 start_codon:yes stop_codon:yes gene_type:complete